VGVLRFLFARRCNQTQEHSTNNTQAHKNARRSLAEKKRSYNWHNPLKNQGNRLKRLQVAKLANPKTNANAKNSTDKQQKMNSYQVTGDVFDDGLNIDGLFEKSGEKEEEVVMFDTEDEAEDSTEEDEDELFVPKKKIRTTPPSTTRQLVNLVRKNMDALSHLAVVSPGKPENIPGYEFSVRLRLAMDKIRYDEAGDMAPGKLVLYYFFGFSHESRELRSRSGPVGAECNSSPPRLLASSEFSTFCSANLLGRRDRHSARSPRSARGNLIGGGLVVIVFSREPSGYFGHIIHVELA
jgi:hypothetical protein